MQANTTTTTYLLDKRRTKKTGHYPVKITVYHDGEKKRYKTGVDLTEAEWEKLWLPNLRDDELKQKRRKIELKKRAIEEIISNLNPFTFSDFESFLFSEKKVKASSYLESLFNQYIEDLEKEERIGTAISYQTTLNSLIAFRGNKRIAEINQQYLRDYEKHLAMEGKSPSTAGIYLRQLRRIFNYSIEKGIISPVKYPFKGYVIPTARNIKKSLNEQQLKQLLNYEPKFEQTKRALDFWIFSYLSNGMNMADICLLKKESIRGEFFSFFRAKTKNTKKRDLRPIKVPLLPRSIEIIDRWKSTDENSPYLFPMLEEGLSARQIKFRIQDFVKMVNTEMKRVAKELEIGVALGTYVARHTHSTILKRKGVSTEVIKENLGHSSVATTESYLDDFTDELKQSFAKLLIDL